MKRFIFLFVLPAILSIHVVSAQATATFTASATIIQPIGITTTSDMNFANIDAKSGGAVILTPENTRISSGGVELADGTNVSAAEFEVTGQSGYSFSISLPDGQYDLTNGNENMVLKDFTSSIVDGGNLSDGSKLVRVGATLEVNAKQPPGTYTTPRNLEVSVNYN